MAYLLGRKDESIVNLLGPAAAKQLAEKPAPPEAAAAEPAAADPTAAEPTAAAK